MIVDYNDTLLKLHSAPFWFYLTGSRYFGNAFPDSDYNLLTDYSEEVVDYLTNEGFDDLEMLPEDYDPSVAMVMVKVKDNIKVHLIESRFMVRKLEAQHLIKELGLNECLVHANSEQQRLFWTMLLGE